MSIFITKIKLYNFRRFREFVIEPNTKNNILIGDNESGKSTILEAIDLVSGGNNRRVEAIGLDNLLNIEAVTEFINSDRCYADLPKLRVELYLSGASDPSVNGENNSDKIECDGIKLVCEPNEDYKTEITSAMDAQSDYFPYEYYSIRFSTFADQVYTGYKRKLRCAMVNSDNMDSEYATNDFIKRTYYQYTGDDAKERAIFRSKYRQMRKVFCADSLKPLNDRIPQEKHYTFGLKNSPASALENNLMIYEDEISIDNKGTGRQIFIKTDFALEHAGSNVDVILLEEPETHLSHVNLKKLIQKIAKTQAGQIFIATHNSLTDSNLNHTGIYLYSKGKIMIHLTFDYKTDEKCTTPGQYLKYHRTFQGFTTRELAEKVGIVPATLVLYENDRHPIKHSTAVALANALGIDRNRLLDKYTAFVDYPYSSLLKKVRQELSLTQMQMAEVIGIGQTSYSGWEREIRVPRRKEYEKILAALKKLKVNVDIYLCHPAST